MNYLLENPQYGLAQLGLGRRGQGGPDLLGRQGGRWWHGGRERFGWTQGIQGQGQLARRRVGAWGVSEAGAAGHWRPSARTGGGSPRAPAGRWAPHARR